MKFDYIIGNPPYQETQETNNKNEAIYHLFYDAASQISDKYILISPARFLFNAGLTPKAWNKKMLSDQHIKVENYYSNSSEVFLNVNINGGVAIVYRDVNADFTPIGVFVPNEVLRSIAAKTSNNSSCNLSSIMYGGRSDLKFNDYFFQCFPDAKDYILKTIQLKHPSIEKLGPGEEYEIKSSSFERTPFAFMNEKPNDDNEYYRIYGLENGKRTSKWIKKEYLSPRFPNNNNIEGYKVYISKADGAAGQIGKPVPARIIGKPDCAEPDASFVPSFISIGNFSTDGEAQNLSKYLRTKFVRTLIGVLKVTQDITPEKCKYVPLQNFTTSSDIDWSKTIAEIDQQLYKKYGFTQREIDFIETHVKEME